MGQIPYRLVKSSKKSFLLKFNMPNIIYTLACYLFYCISVYFFIENTATYSKNFPEISLIGNYNPFISFAARSSQFLLFCRRLITFFSISLVQLKVTFFCRLVLIPFQSPLGHFMHVVIGFIISHIGFIFSFVKARNLLAFVNELHKIDDELLDLCDGVRIDHKKSLFFQLKMFSVSVLLMCLVGGFDYYVFQG